MKITDVSVRLVLVPLDRIFRGSTYQVDSRCTVIVRVETDEGVVGEAYSGDERNAYRHIRDLITQRFRPLVVGEDCLAIERIWQKLFEVTPHISAKGVAMRAISAIDLALWDLIGKALETPLWRLIGGARAELPIIGYTYYEDDQPYEYVADVALQQAEQGYAGTKLKVGGVAVKDDVSRVTFVRKAVGDDFILACDANRAWTVAEALDFARRTADLGLAWLEEPVRWHGEVDGMRRVRESTTAPITAGQSEISGFGCMDLMRGGAVDYLNVDASMIGGVTAWRRIAAAATFFDVGMVHHEEPQVAIHLLASVPHSFCAELFPDPVRDPVWHHMYPSHPEPRRGMISPPDRPGLGIEIDGEFVERYMVE